MSTRFLSQTATRKPRVALMGEFSAGKSTLANLLLGRESSPVQVTATQLPPVWYRLGDDRVTRVASDGTREPMTMEDWRAAGPDTTRMISVRMQADVLEACDLIDMPGTSDPCMAPDHWAQVLPLVDLVIWCTPANQAWRQSEAALWDQVPQELWARSLLLVTRIDTLNNGHDRGRVVGRVRAETRGMFREVLPIALTDAIAGRDNARTLEQTGAAGLVRFLESGFDGLTLAPKPDCLPEVRPESPRAPVVVRRAGTGSRVVPRRVIRGVSARSPA